MRRGGSAFSAGLLGLALITGGCLHSTAPMRSEVPWPASRPAAPAYALKAEYDRRVAMRDGVTLSADVFRPDAPGTFPVILQRTPYVKATLSERSLARIRYFVSRGYVFVVMDVRGRGDSDGRFSPFRQEGPDGYDAVEWCAAQPWSSGRVGTIGGSYDGYVQWAAAVLAPPHLTAMIPMVACPDPFVDGIQGGPEGTPPPLMVYWYSLTSGRQNQGSAGTDWERVYRHRPLRTMDAAAGREIAAWRDMFDHPQLDAWWEPARYQNKFDRVRAAVLHVSGWYDDEQIGTIRNFTGMTQAAIDPAVRARQKLLMGPWPHNINSGTMIGTIDYGPTATIDLNTYCLRWFDRWLKEIDNGVDREPPVRIFGMAGRGWRDEGEWPIARMKPTRWYLHGDGRSAGASGARGVLSIAAPESEPPDLYQYDPANPTPFITEPTSAQVGGPDDYRPVESRADVLVYTSQPLRDDLEVCGAVRATLYAASTARDTDFLARLIDVHPDGFAQRLCDGLVRARFRAGMDLPELIEPGRIYAFEIDCWNTCQSFRAGHRIRLEICSAGFPAHEPNPNTGGPLGRETESVVATQTIYHDAAHPSSVLLPIVPPRTGPPS